MSSQSRIAPPNQRAPARPNIWLGCTPAVAALTGGDHRLDRDSGQPPLAHTWASGFGGGANWVKPHNEAPDKRNYAMAMADHYRTAAPPKPRVPEVRPDDNHAAHARGQGSELASNANAMMVRPLGAETSKEATREAIG